MDRRKTRNNGAGHRKLPLVGTAVGGWVGAIDIWPCPSCIVVRRKAAILTDKGSPRLVVTGKANGLLAYVKCEPLLMFQGKPSRPVSVQWVPANDTVWGKDPSESCPTCSCAISGKEWVRRNPRAWSSVDFELSARDVFMVGAGKLLEVSKLILPVVRVGSDLAFPALLCPHR